MTSGAGGQGWFQGNRCLQWAPSLGGHFPSPQRPTSQLPSAASCYQSRRAHLSFLTYLCHLSSYSLEGKLTLKKQLVRNFGLASPGRCSLKQTPQRPLSSPPASKQKLARGGRLASLQGGPCRLFPPVRLGFRDSYSKLRADWDPLLLAFWKAN